MNKRWLIVGALALAYVLVRWRFRPGSSLWDTIFARMPESAPPKWMFSNIRTIRANTDRILERLDEPAPVARDTVAPTR